jgi:hypothetical protein
MSTFKGCSFLLEGSNTRSARGAVGHKLVKSHALRAREPDPQKSMEISADRKKSADRIRQQSI